MSSSSCSTRWVASVAFERVTMRHIACFAVCLVGVFVFVLEVIHVRVSTAQHTANRAFHSWDETHVEVLYILYIGTTGVM